MGMTRKHAARNQAELEIRTRTELAGDGDSLTLRSKHSPRQLRSVASHECAVCLPDGAMFVGPGNDHALDITSQRSGLEYRSVRDAAERAPVSSIMSHDVVCVREDVSLDSLAGLLLHHGFSGLPVIDQDGRAVGVVSKTDLLRCHHERATAIGTADARAQEFEAGFPTVEAPAAVGDIMTPIAFTVPEEASISAAATLMAAREIHRLPVVDHLGRVVGMLTTIDIVDWVAQGAPRTLLKRDREAGRPPS